MLLMTFSFLTNESRGKDQLCGHCEPLVVVVAAIVVVAVAVVNNHSPWVRNIPISLHENVLSSSNITQPSNLLTSFAKRSIKAPGVQVKLVLVHEIPLLTNVKIKVPYGPIVALTGSVKAR